MAKVYTYVVVTIGMCVLFSMAGLTTFSILSLIGISNTNNTFAFSTSTIFGALFGAAGVLILAGAASGIAVGYITKSPSENFIILPFITGVLALFIGTYVDIVAQANATGSAWLPYLATLIFAPITVGYVVSLVEFFRGTD